MGTASETKFSAVSNGAARTFLKHMEKHGVKPQPQPPRKLPSIKAQKGDDQVLVFIMNGLRQLNIQKLQTSSLHSKTSSYKKTSHEQFLINSKDHEVFAAYLIHAINKINWSETSIETTLSPSRLSHGPLLRRSRTS